MKYVWSRRDFLFQSGGGVSGLALAYLLHKDGLLAAESTAGCNNQPVGGNPYAAKPPHFKARAKAVISLFMTGGPSHVDTFDPKPALAKYAGEPLTGKGDINVRQGWPGPLMPAAYQGSAFRSSGGDPIMDLKPPEGLTSEQQRTRLDLLAKLNELDLQKYPGDSELAARISSYELAFRMQGCAPQAVDLSNESEATRKLYGMDEKMTEPFGRQCLLARRLVERGVRFVQVFSGGLGDQNTDTWDAHVDVKANHSLHAAETDRPITGLLTDLKARGLLDSTLIVWHGEFGRMPISQRGIGRDHNPGAMPIWMAGAGIKGGQVIGASDEF